MNCAWCGANADGSDSHGICAGCAAMLLQAQQERHEKQAAKEQTTPVTHTLQ